MFEGGVDALAFFFSYVGYGVVPGLASEGAVAGGLPVFGFLYFGVGPGPVDYYEY